MPSSQQWNVKTRMDVVRKPFILYIISSCCYISSCCFVKPAEGRAERVVCYLDTRGVDAMARPADSVISVTLQSAYLKPSEAWIIPLTNPATFEMPSGSLAARRCGTGRRRHSIRPDDVHRFRKVGPCVNLVYIRLSRCRCSDLMMRPVSGRLNSNAMEVLTVLEAAA